MFKKYLPCSNLGTLQITDGLCSLRFEGHAIIKPHSHVFRQIDAK